MGTSALPGCLHRGPSEVHLWFGGDLPRYGRGERGHSDLQGRAVETCSPPEAKHSSYGTMWVKDVGAGSLRACVPRELLPVYCYLPRMCPSYLEWAGDVCPGDMLLSTVHFFALQGDL